MRFKKFFIEITNVCNLSCPFCPKTARPPAFMTPALFEKILTGVAGKAEDLYFHVLGEPLLHPELGRFLDSSAERGFRVRLVTNGTLLREAGEMLLSKPALKQVSVSLHSFGSRPGLESYLDSVLGFARRASAAGVLVTLRLWNQDAEGRVSEGDRAVLDALRTEFRFSDPIPGDMGPGRGVRLAPRIFLSSMSRFEWPSLDSDSPEEEGACLGVRAQAAVLAAGEVVPCCLDRDGVVLLGNIRERPFDEILSGERARGIAEAFRRGRAAERLCRKCGYKKRFSGRAPTSAPK
ncbi:MAG: radical SAM/SPASM domain-containing protein [Elusimicrobiota bacterium]